MVRIRMQRTGRRNRDFFRISAVDQRARRDGRVVEQLGWYDPLAKDPAKEINLNEERVKYWLGVGALPSATVADVFAKRNLLTPAVKAQWEAQRARDRVRVEAKVAAEAAAPKDDKAKKK